MGQSAQKRVIGTPFRPGNYFGIGPEDLENIDPELVAAKRKYSSFYIQCIYSKILSEPAKNLQESDDEYDKPLLEAAVRKLARKMMLTGDLTILEHMLIRSGNVPPKTENTNIQVNMTAANPQEILDLIPKQQIVEILRAANAESAQRVNHRAFSSPDVVRRRPDVQAMATTDPDPQGDT